VYQWFLINELPPVASGLAMAGLFAVSQGSMDSAINALASSAVADIYLPLRTMRGRPIDPDKPVDAPKVAVAAMGAAGFLGGWWGPLLPGPAWVLAKSLALLVLLVAAGQLLARVPIERFVVVAWAVLTASLGIWLGTIGVVGFFYRPVAAGARTLFIAAGVLTLIPADMFPGAIVTDIVGLSLGAVLVARELFQKRWQSS